MKKIHIISIILIAVSIGILISAMGDVDTYSTFEDASQREGRKVKIVGQLAKDKEIVYNPQIDPNYFSFFLIDSEGTERKVVLLQSKPQDFERSEQIVLTGSMGDEAFVATDLLMKCPSKYKDEELNLREAKS